MNLSDNRHRPAFLPGELPRVAVALGLGAGPLLEARAHILFSDDIIPEEGGCWMKNERNILYIYILHKFQLHLHLFILSGLSQYQYQYQECVAEVYVYGFMPPVYVYESGYPLSLSG